MGANDKIHIKRWHIWKCKWFQIYLHNFLHDDDPIFHDHPRNSISFLLSGKLFEWIYNAAQKKSDVSIVPRIRLRSADHAHYIYVVRPAWTLFITGPIKREWGFWQHKKWYNAKELKTEQDNVSSIKGE